MHTYIALCLTCGTIVSEVQGIQTNNVGSSCNYSPATQKLKRGKETTRLPIRVFIRQSSISIILTVAVQMPLSIDFIQGNTSPPGTERLTTNDDHSKAKFSLASSL